MVVVRKYLDFTSYWVTLFVVLANTAVICVLAKHLWRAWWIKDPGGAGTGATTGKRRVKYLGNVRVWVRQT